MKDKTTMLCIAARISTFAIALALAFAPLQSASAAGGPHHVGAAYAVKSGSGPRAVILIPGLGCGGYVYDGVGPGLAARYTVYTITFAGFDGEPAAQGPYLPAFAQSIVDLIAQEKLNKPVLVGHSLGGYVALRVGATIPDKVGGVVAVDTLPLFPPMRPGDTLSERATVMGYVRDQMIAAPAAAFETQAKSSVRALVTADKDLDLILAHEMKSDRATLAGSFYEMSIADLHPQLAKISAPVLVLAESPSDEQSAGVSAYFTQEYAGTPNFTVQAIAPSKHFIMFDQPQKFASALDAFLAKVAP